MKRRTMGCRRARADLLREVDRRLGACPEEDLDLERNFALQAHLKSCAACRSLSEGLGLLEEGSARLSLQADTAGEQLDLDAALERLGVAIDAVSIDSVSIDSVSGPNPTPVRGPGRRQDFAVPNDAPGPLVGVGFGPGVLAVAVGLLVLFGWWWLGFGSVGRGAALQPGESLSLSKLSELSELSGPPELSDSELERAVREAASARFRKASGREFAGLVASYRDPFDPARAFEAASGAADRVDAALADLVADGWPLARLAEGWIQDRGRGVAAAAILYLGARGDGATAVGLRNLVRDPELGAVAVVALGHLASRGVRGGLVGLRRALDLPERAPDAVACLVGVSSSEAAEVLLEALRSGRTLRRLEEGLGAEFTARRLLLDGLAEIGPPAVDSLFALALDAARGTPLHPGPSTAEVPAKVEHLLEIITGIGNHGPALAQSLERDEGTPVAFAAVARSGSEALLPWLEERAAVTRSRVRALDVLAEMPGQGVVAVLARLTRRDRISADEMEATLEQILHFDAERVGHWIAARERLLAAGAAERDAQLELEALGELLLAGGCRQAGPALLALTLAAHLPADERVWAALALAETDDAASAFDLARALESGLSLEAAGGQFSTSSGARVFAAQLLAVHSVLGSGALGRCLDVAGLAQAAAVRVAVEQVSERGSLAVGVHRVARALDDRRGAGLAQLHRRNSQ